MDALDKNDLKNLKNFFNNRTKNIKDEKDLILSIIGKHLEEIDNSKLSEIEKYDNKKELNDVGNFIKLFDSNILIEEAIRKEPDFLVRKNKKLIGVDLNVIYNDSTIIETRIDTIFKQIEEELKDDVSKIKGVYKIKFNEKTFFNAEDSVLKKAIIKGVKNPETSSEYIEFIEKSSGDTFYLLMHEITSLNLLTNEVINETILKKEEKLNEYKASSKAKEFWLLLVLNDENDYASILKNQFKTAYEKVFICDFTNSKIIELKTD